MKRSIGTILALTILSVALHAAEKIEAGPKGGRLLKTDAPRPEFFVEKDRTVSIAFYDSNKKPVAVQGQSITAVAESKKGKTKLTFEKKGDVLVSKTALPEGEGYTVVVQYRKTADAKPQNFRIPLNLHVCGECKLSEYACICADH